MMAARPRLLMLTPDFPPMRGGIARLCGEIAANLERFDVDVVTFKSTHDGPSPKPGYRVSRPLPRAPGRAHKVAVAALNGTGIGRAVARRPDLVHCGHVTMAPAARAIARTLRVPYVQHVYADEFRTRPRVCSYAMSSAARVIAISAYGRELALAHDADPERLAVVPCGTDLPARWSAERGEAPVLITVARLEAAHKGHDVVMRALPAIVEAVPGARWIAVGGPPPRHLLELAAKLQIDDAIVWAGAVGDQERDRLLESATVFVMPSRIPDGGVGGEGFGIAYLEAGAHGLPVVGSNVGGPVDAIVPGETGDLVDPTDPAAVAEAVIGLLRDPDRARRYGKAGRRHAEEHEWPKVVARLEPHLIEALETSRR
jgi:phosphatidylinositol alpha-1,6-mannosyltransferase